MDRFVQMLQEWLGQGVARRNAAMASARLQHRRRQREAVNAFLSQHLDGGEFPLPRPQTAGLGSASARSAPSAAAADAP